MTKEDLQQLFKDWKTTEIKIKDKGRTNVFGFIEFEDSTEAEDALNK